MEDVNISKFRAQVVRSGSTPASPGFVVSEGQNPVDPSGSGQNHLPVTIGSPANGLAVTDAQVLTIDKAQIFAGTSSQFVKGDGTLDSNTYGTGTVTSVALTMPTAFSVANSPVTTTGTLAVTATGTTSQYIRGDGSLATFPAVSGFVPYTGATADVNLGTHDLAAERGTFANNGSSDTLTVNHTSGSGYGIIVTKGGNNEALYVSKTSGSGNAMTVVGGRTSLVDLALSSVTNTAGDFLTLSGGVVHKRTAAQTLTDIGGQAALTNPVTGTGTSGQVAYFNGTSAITGESGFTWDATNNYLSIGGATPNSNLTVSGSDNSIIFSVLAGVNSRLHVGTVSSGTIAYVRSQNNYALNLGVNNTDYLSISTAGNSSFSGNIILTNGANRFVRIGSLSNYNYDLQTTGDDFQIIEAGLTIATPRLTIKYPNGYVGIGTTTPSTKLEVNGDITISKTGVANLNITSTDANSVLKLNTANSFVSYIQYNSSGNSGLEFYDINNAATRIMITTGGNVGIGFTPSAWDNTIFRPLQIGASGSFLIGRTDAVSQTQLGANAFYDGNWKYIISTSAAATRYYQNGGEHVFESAAVGTSGNVISWSTKLFINTSGFLKASNNGVFAGSASTYHELISSQSGNNIAYLWNTSANPYGPYIRFSGAAPNNGTNYYFYCDDTSAARFIVYSNGGISNYQANNTNLSDERTKKEIKPLESYWNKFKAIEIVKFKYKDQTHDDFNIGVIAQQVEKVAPEFVDVDGWNNKTEGNEIISHEEPIKSIYTADLHHATIKVLQEAMAKIESMQKEIDTLKN
jgi:hypothetical protein